MRPGVDQIDGAMVAVFRIESAGEVFPLRGDSPVALASIAVSAHVTTQRDQRGGSDVNRVGAQRNRLDDVGGATNRPGRDKGNLLSNPLVAQPLVDNRQSQFDWDADVVTNASRGGAGASAKAVDNNRVRACARRSRRNRRRIVNRRNLDENRLRVVGRLFNRVNQLAQVFNRVNIVMGRGRNRVRSLRNSARAADFLVDLLARQMPADSWLGALTDFDFHRGAVHQIIFVDAESSGRDLNDAVFRVRQQVVMKTAFAAVERRAQLLRRHRQRLLSVEADRPKRHCGEHNRRFQFQLRRHNGRRFDVRTEAFRLAPQKSARFHRLAQRVNGRVGNL